MSRWFSLCCEIGASRYGCKCKRAWKFWTHFERQQQKVKMKRRERKVWIKKTKQEERNEMSEMKKTEELGSSLWKEMVLGLPSNSYLA